MTFGAVCVALLHRSLLQKHVSTSPAEVQPSVVATAEHERVVTENKDIKYLEETHSQLCRN